MLATWDVSWPITRTERYQGPEHHRVKHRVVEGTVSELADWSDKSPHDGRGEEDRGNWAHELLGLVGVTDVSESLEQEIPEPDFQESCHGDSKGLSWDVRVRADTYIEVGFRGVPQKVIRGGIFM